MQKLFVIAAGGALGAVLRYAVSGLAYRVFGEAFPWGTLVVNVAGSFAVGLLWGLSERALVPPRLAPFLFIGVLGAFTTFSTYSLETLNLLRAGKTELTLLNVGASNGLCLLAVYAGFPAAMNGASAAAEVFAERDAEGLAN